jgi:cell wall-associated NlpC family hydrolase
MRTPLRPLTLLALCGAVAAASPAAAQAASHAKHASHRKGTASHPATVSRSDGGALYDAGAATPPAATSSATTAATGGATDTTTSKPAKSSSGAPKHTTTTSTGGRTIAAAVAAPSGATGADGATGVATAGGATAPSVPTGSTGATGPTGSSGPTGPTVPGWEAKILADGLAQAPADAPVAVKEAIAAGNQLIGQPYVYGGGHQSFISNGYDCSGAVSYALHGGSLLTSPLDSSQFELWGAAGRGTWITVYTNPTHAYMTIAGIRFDTSRAGDPGGKSGPRWRPLLASNAGFIARHPAGL